MTKTPDDAAAAHIRRIVDEAPPLSPGQRDRLAVLFRTAPALSPHKQAHGVSKEAAA